MKATLDESKGVLQLPLIKNKKTVNPRESDTPAVFQLETAMGSAIECFNDAGAVVVPRDRFAPVKTCNDLFALRSDVYEVGGLSSSRVLMQKNALALSACLALTFSQEQLSNARVMVFVCEELMCVPQVTKESTVVLAVPSCPMIKLDDKHYKLVDKMEALTEAPPSLIACKSLTVKGPVKFVKGVVIKGDVTFENGRCN